MPGRIIRPDLKPLNRERKNYLINYCDAQPDETILHYLQTKEITLSELTKLSDSRKDRLKSSYEAWLAEPDPEEISAWDAITPYIGNKARYNSEMEDKLMTFISRFPMSAHRSEAETMIREIRKRQIEAQSAPLLEEWHSICAMPEDHLHQMENKRAQMEDFIRDNRQTLSRMLGDFQQNLEELKTRIAHKDLESIRFDFDELLRAIKRQPRGSELYNIADEYLWALLTDNLDADMLKQYIRKVPGSAHYVEAEDILKKLNMWEPVRNSGDLFKVWSFLDDPNLHDAIRENAEDLLNRLKRSEIEKMEENPSAYDRRRFLGLMNAGLITLNELVRRGLITLDAYETAKDRDDFINHNPIDVGYTHSEVLDQEDITDVYLFGVPSTGKTCVLMGLLGSGLYDWNNAIAAGEYGDILTRYRDNHILPPRTRNEQFFCIHGSIQDSNKKKHLVNVIELAGEQFLDKIAMNPNRELSLVDMDAIAAGHFRNKNRKIFFIVIDPTVSEIEYTRETKVVDDEGNVKTDSQTLRVAQKTVIKKMMNILKDSKNKDIMNKVDALHFIATKSDVIDHAQMNIKDCVTQYSDSIRTAYELCQPGNAQINEATGYKPKLYSFSLGKFYVGGAFDYDPTDSDKLIRVIADNTLAIRDYTFIEKFFDSILNFKVL